MTSEGEDGNKSPNQNTLRQIIDHGHPWRWMSLLCLMWVFYFLQFYQVYKKKWNVTVLLCVFLQMIYWMKFSTNEQHIMEKCFNYFLFQEIGLQITCWFFDAWLIHWSPTSPAKWDSICSLDHYSRQHLKDKVVAECSSPISNMFPSLQEKHLFICKYPIFTSPHFLTSCKFFKRVFF